MDVQGTANEFITNLQNWLPSAVSLVTVNTLSAVFVARAALTKNRSWFAFFWLSLIATSLVMSVVVAALPTAEEHLPNRRRCPHCAEFVRCEASLCRYCGSTLTPMPAKQTRVQQINPLWFLGSFTIAMSLAVMALALTKVLPDALWLGWALLVAGGFVLWRVPRKTNR